jgi:hypothetical protein
MQALLEGALVALIVVGLIAGTAFAGQGAHGGGGTGCTVNTPALAVQNTWAWSATGSYGLAGQRLTYQVQVVNYDTGCRSASFVLSASAPDGFALSIPTKSITLKSGGSGFLSAYVTSPSGAADGTYPVTFDVARTGTSSPTGSATTYYKVYSSDTAAPTVYWPNPGDGEAISGRSIWIQASAKDDHAVKEIKVSVDGAAKATKVCDGIAYSCTLYYSWSTVKGAHSATFTATDWMDNADSTTVTFTVN